MKRSSLLLVVALVALLGFALAGCGGEADKASTAKAGGDTIVLGFNIPLTGDIPKLGESSRFAADLWLQQNGNTVEVDGKQYTLRFVYEDNESKAESAVNAQLKLIEQNRVLAVIGPMASKQAVPAGEVADANQTPMIAPWSTNPATTIDRPFVFRACFLDPFQGPVAARFATEEFGATKAAVLFDIASDYPKGLAEYFRAAWEEIHGPGSLVAYETFTTKDQDFSAQLTKIVRSGADVLFTPQYYSEVALIVKQAQQLGWRKPIMGSDSWGSAELMTLCGDACKGYYFSTHYAAAGAVGATKEFIDSYSARYGYVPDDVAALTWDAIGMMVQAVKSTGGLSGNLAKDRVAVKDQLAAIPVYDGITGSMNFDEQGDPVKSAVIVKINDAGEFEFFKSVAP